MSNNDNNEWWRGAVIYQIYPRSFMDSNGDGVGDLRGLISKLDYVAELGVDAIWISPFFKSPMKDFGYDIADYRDVDPLFGTIDDFRVLLKEAHARDLKIIIDQVWSHTSDQHGWFKESRGNRTNAKKDWYIWADCKPDGTPPNNWLSLFGGPAWEWDTRREQYYLHHFLTCQPALNLWNEEVRQEILNTARYWLDMGVDGFRLDVINCALSDKDLTDNPVRPADMPPPTDMSTANPMARQIRKNAYGYMSEDTFKWLNLLRGVTDEYGGKFLMGEIGGDDGDRLAAQYIDTDTRLHSAYNFSLTGKRITRDIVVEAIRTFEELVPDGRMTFALGNHDNQRFASGHGQHAPVREDYARLGMAVLLSLRGSVCLYQGEELGLPTAEISFEDMQDPYDIRMYPDSMNRDSGRTPLPWIESAHQAGFSTATKTWLPVQESHMELAVDKQDKDENSVLNAYRALLKWRKETPAIRSGAMTLLETEGDIVAFIRSHGDRKILCVFNCANDDSAWTLPHAGKLIAALSHNIKADGNTISFGRYGYGFFDLS